MAVTETEVRPVCGLKPPERNHYFYGKLLDTYHFQLETAYFNTKRWMLNRLVSGYGVVCGLDVEYVEEEDAVAVTPGVAIDKHGREIVIEKQTPPVPIPVELAEAAEGEEGAYLHVLLCYHECPVEPTPVLAGECSTQHSCEPGVIRERYEITFGPGCLPVPEPTMYIPDVIRGEQHGYHLDYATLVRWISRDCPPCAEDSCIPLANLYLQSGGTRPCRPEVDITVRPIVYSNDLLFQLLLSLMREPGDYRTGK
jgi:hypothetical protein